MDVVAFLFDFIIHLDKHLLWLIQNYGVWIYLILFLIIFCETGLVVTPFLPGDSLLFVAGTLAATGAMDIHLLQLLLFIAAVAGDNTNYWIGRFVGPKVFTKTESLFFKPVYLERTQAFYEKHGSKVLIISRFMPIFRTFAPFVAGIGRMVYLRMICYSVIGGLLWTGSFLYGGYYFGNIPIVKQNLTACIFAIIIISILPGIITYVRERARKPS